jgi:hypothetical protein
MDSESEPGGCRLEQQALRDSASGSLRRVNQLLRIATLLINERPYRHFSVSGSHFETESESIIDPIKPTVNTSSLKKIS